MLLLFLSAFVVGLSGAMMPGSLLTYTIRKVLSNGPRAGFMITLGHILLEFVLIIVLIFGIGHGASVSTGADYHSAWSAAPCLALWGST